MTQGQDSSSGLQQGAPQPVDRRDRWISLAIFAGVALVYLLTATYDGAQVNDTRETNVSGWSLATRGTLALPDSWEDRLRWSVEGQDGRHYTNRFPGAVMVSAGAYWVADRFDVVPEPATPLLLNFAPGGAAAALVTALGVALLFRVYREVVARRWAVSGALTMAFATGLWSVSANALWTHSITGVALAGGMLAASRARYLGAGAWFALSVFSRPQTAVIPAVIGLWQGAVERDLRPVLKLGAVSFLGVIALSVYSQVLFGTWLPLAGYSSGRLDQVVGTGIGEFGSRVANALLHRERGLLVYTPLVLVLLPFLWRGWRVAPAWVRSSAIGGVVYAIVQLRSNTWHGGLDYFGNRLLLETLVAASPLMLISARQTLPNARPVQIISGVTIFCSVVLHALGATVQSAPDNGQSRWQHMLEEECDRFPDEPACESITRQALGEARQSASRERMIR